MSFRRRDFLKTIGLSAAALGLRQGFGASGARAQYDIPLRIVFYYDTVGILRGSGYPRSPMGAPWPTETEWELPELLAPLSPWKDRTTMLAGLDMLSDRADPTGAANAHIAGQTHALTAAFRRDADVAGGVSINQFIAHHLNDPEPVTRLPSVEAAVRIWGDVNDGGTYDMTGAPVPFLIEPPDLYARLFPDELRLSGAEAMRAARRRAAIGDFVRGESDRLIARLSGDQRLKIEQHRDAHADLQRRLGLGGDRLGNVPAPSITDDWGAVNWGYDVSESDKADIWTTMGRLNTQMVASALHADITRVATLHVSHPANDLWGYTNGDYGSDDWHDLVHKLSGDDPDITDPMAVNLIKQMHLRSTELLASFLTELENRTEPDGSSLLDHTLVVFCSELADGSHDLGRLPWAYIGDAHGYLRTNRAITFDRVIDNMAHRQYGELVGPDEWARYNQAGKPHNDFFVTLANAMGIETDVFGEPSVCTGAISELLV